MPGVLGRFAPLVAAVSVFVQRGVPHSSVAADPATDLVRTRAFLTTTSTSADLTVDGVSLANAIFAVRSGDSSVRAKMDGNTVHVTGNKAGATADVQIDMVLAHVAPGQTVAWNLSLGSAGTTELQIQNLNRDAAAGVDHFVTTARTERLTTRGDLLRDGGPLAVPSGASHLLLAFFYPWYDSTTWSSPSFLDNPAQPYSTDDPADLARLARQARSAGLDALAVSWQGADFGGGWNHRRMLLTLDAAQAGGLKIATLVETTVANPQHDQDHVPPDPETVLAWLKDIVDLYAKHPAYLRVDNRPVVFAYAAQRLAETQWLDLLARLRASGRDVLFVGEGNDDSRLLAFDGLFYYASNLFQGDDVRAFEESQSLAAHTYGLLPGVPGGRRLWVATVSPGYDDTRLTDGRVPRVSDRAGGAYYNTQWRSALDMNADWIAITSWNEWFENTEIEPSQRYADFYLRRTKAWTSLFRLLRPYAVPR